MQVRLVNMHCIRKSTALWLCLSEIENKKNWDRITLYQIKELLRILFIL